jgi:hypothetical protein
MAMWEQEIFLHRDDIHTYISSTCIAFVPKWLTKLIFFTHNCILLSTIFSSVGASHVKSRSVNRFYPPSVRCWLDWTASILTFVNYTVFTKCNFLLSYLTSINFRNISYYLRILVLPNWPQPQNTSPLLSNPTDTITIFIWNFWHLWHSVPKRFTTPGLDPTETIHRVIYKWLYIHRTI